MKKTAKFLLLAAAATASATANAQEPAKPHKTAETITIHTSNTRDTYFYCGQYANGRFAVYNHTDIAVYDENGQQVTRYVPKTFINVIVPVYNGSGYAITSTEKSGLCMLDKDGKEVKKLPGSCASTKFTDGLAYIWDGSGATAFINENGDRVHNDLTFTAEHSLYMKYWDNPKALTENRRGYFDPKAHKFGFLDSEGNKIIEAKFNDVRPFSEGLAAVRVDDTWGFIDTSGKYVIQPVFHNTPGDFHNGKAVIKKNNGNYVYIDRNANVVSDEYYSANRFFNGYALVQSTKDFKNYVVSGMFMTIREFPSYLLNSIAYDEANKLIVAENKTVYNHRGECLLNLGNGNFYDGFNEGLAPFYIVTDKGKTHGYINLEGEIKYAVEESQW